MATPQRARSAVPLEQRSALPSIPGLPWWGVVLTAVGITALGVLVDGIRGDQLTATSSTMYVLGCVVAVVLASNKAIFTAIVQAPLLLFAAVPIASYLIADDTQLGKRQVVLTMAYPLVDRFPVMLLATIAVAVIGVARLVTYARAGQATKTARPRTGTRQRRSAPSTRTRTARQQGPVVGRSGAPAPVTGRLRRPSAATPTAPAPRPRPVPQPPSSDDLPFTSADIPKLRYRDRAPEDEAGTPAAP